MSDQWVRFNDGLQSLGASEAVRAIGLLDRCLQTAGESTNQQALLDQLLPELVTEFSAQWCGVLVRNPGWELQVDYGRQRPPSWPSALLEESLDRGAAGGESIAEPEGWSAAAVPLDDSAPSASVLLIAGGHLDLSQLPLLSVAGRGLSVARGVASRTEQAMKRAERLASTLNASAGFAGVHEVVPLLELIASEATRLLDCDRASIFVHDRERGELVACPALGVEGGTLRIPDNAGIVGDVIHNGQPVQVDDVTTDDRFNADVDKETGYTTRNLLCVPLRDGREEVMGAFELINRIEGSFNEDDLEGLEHLAGQAAVALANTQEHQRLLRSREQLAEQVSRGARLVGTSPAIIALRDTVDRLAGTDLPVLVLGPSGTGKEVVSRALHFGGSRADQPFVAVNCAAISPHLVESELFGHEQGAFTGATRQTEGKFGMADGGTLFLDEIGDMPLDMQVKILRALPERKYYRVGGKDEISVDIRVIAATNADLKRGIEDGSFREDLYFRLAVVTVETPPLRDREEDVFEIAEHFLNQGGSPIKLTKPTQECLRNYPWPGNVRELENVCRRIMIMAPSREIECEDLPQELLAGPDPGSKAGEDWESALRRWAERRLKNTDTPILDEAVPRFESAMIRVALNTTRGRRQEAARLLGWGRNTLTRKIKELELDV